MVAERGEAPVPATQVGGLVTSTIPSRTWPRGDREGLAALAWTRFPKGTQVGSLRLRAGANPDWSVVEDTSTPVRFPGAFNATDVSPPTCDKGWNIKRTIGSSGSPTE